MVSLPSLPSFKSIPHHYNHSLDLLLLCHFCLGKPQLQHCLLCSQEKEHNCFFHSKLRMAPLRRPFHMASPFTFWPSHRILRTFSSLLTTHRPLLTLIFTDKSSYFTEKKKKEENGPAPTMPAPLLRSPSSHQGRVYGCSTWAHSQQMSPLPLHQRVHSVQNHFPRTVQKCCNFGHLNQTFSGPQLSL